jgi:hypothetical protein
MKPRCTFLTISLQNLYIRLKTIIPSISLQFLRELLSEYLLTVNKPVTDNPVSVHVYLSTRNTYRHMFLYS